MSDLSNFTIYKENAGMAAVIDPLAPLAGTGTLLLHRNGQAATKINLARAIAPRAFTSGKARFLVGIKTSVLSSLDQAGFAFQQSQEDLTGVTGAAYLVGLMTGDFGTGSNLRLFRCSAGLGTQTELGAGATFTLAINTPIAVEVTWILDIAGLGGIRLTVKYNTAGIFSGMTTAVDIVSTTTVLQTSVTEGPYLRHGTTSSLEQRLFETADTDVVPLLVGA